MTIRPYYEEDGITLYCGDCRAVLPQLSNIETVLTDPPYGIDLKPQRKNTKSIQGDTEVEAKTLLEFALEYTARCAPEDSAHFFFARWSEPWYLESLKKFFQVKGCIVWRKNQFGIGYHLRPQHEFCYLVHKGSPAAPLEARSDVWDYDKVRTPIHSCEKPASLLIALLKYYNQSGVVLDPFCGVGSTLWAAKKLGRKAIGIEVDENYCKEAVKSLARRVLFT